MFPFDDVIMGSNGPEQLLPWNSHNDDFHLKVKAHVKVIFILGYTFVLEVLLSSLDAAWE